MLQYKCSEKLCTARIWKNFTGLGTAYILSWRAPHRSIFVRSKVVLTHILQAPAERPSGTSW